jgi:putative toxin-antitoxin system antitoxin component (TIGR02293 family)
MRQLAQRDVKSGAFEFDESAMEIPLDSNLSQRLGRIFGLKSGATELALARSDRAQLGAALLRSLEEQPLLSPADIHRIVPRRTWLRRRAEARLSRDEFDGLYRLVRTQALAELVFGDAERARAWLHSPKERLGGATPMGYAADTLGFEAVQAWLHEIDQGWFA